MRPKGLITSLALAVAGFSGVAVADPRQQGPAQGQPATLPATAADTVAKMAQRKLTVNQAVLVANGSMLEVRFTVPPATTTQWIPTDPKDTYVVDEATGEKYFVLNLVRIGPAAQVRLPKGGGSSYMIIDNRYEHLKAGARITVIIGALKEEHVTVAEQ